MKKRLLVASTSLLLFAGGLFAVLPIQTMYATNYTVHWYKRYDTHQDFYFAQKHTPSCRPDDYGMYEYKGTVTRTSPGIACVVGPGIP